MIITRQQLNRPKPDMRTAYLLFIIVSFGALTPALSPAGETSSQPPQLASSENRANGNHPESKREINQATEKGNAAQAKLQHALQQPKAVKVGLTPGQTQRQHHQPVLLPVSKTSAPVVVGGPTASNPKSGAVINGTAMKHKP